MTTSRDRSTLARSRLRLLRYALWLGVVVAVGFIGWRAYNMVEGGPTMTSSIGGPFKLVDQHGATVTEASLKGHPSAMFFGYTFCPDVCPTTLSDATSWLKKLGPDGDKLKFYFVTVDPERDTEAQMAAYLQAFDPRIIGLTGPRPDVDTMLKAYKVYSKKVGGGDDYSMDHSAGVYLLNADGQLVGTADYQEADDTVMAKLKRLVVGS